jgi:hypothetical protein
MRAAGRTEAGGSPPRVASGSADAPIHALAREGGDLLKKPYARPELREYGRAEQLTMGTDGSQPDFVLVSGQLIANPNNPTCVNNGAPYLACVAIP